MSSHLISKDPNRKTKRRFPAFPRPTAPVLATFLGLAFPALPLILPTSVEAAVSASATSGNLTDLSNADDDVSVLSTTTSGTDIQVIGIGFTTTSFSNVNNIAILFGGPNETAAFDSSAFSFASSVTINTWGAGTSDAVSKLGANTLTITGASNYLGGTTINGGALQIGNGGVTGSIVGNVLDNASLVFNRGDSLAFAGNITGSGSVTKYGAGALTLTGTGSKYAGSTTINDGTLNFSNAGALGTGTINLGTGAELHSLGNAILTNQVVSAAAGTTLTIGSLQIYGGNAIFGSAGNTGTVVIGPQTGEYVINTAATIEVAFGTLRNGATASQGLGSFTGNVIATTVDAGATLDLNNQSLTATNLLGAGSVTLGTSAATALTVNAGAFSGVIKGAGRLDKETAGALELTGANTFTGGTTINAGTLQIGNGGTTGSVVGYIIDNGSLVFDRSDSVTFAGNITGSGSVIKDGAGTLTLTGTGSSYSSGTVINGGTLSFNNAKALGTGPITLGIGTEFRSLATATLTNPVVFAQGGASVVSAAAGTTLTIGSLQVGNSVPASAVFGSAGETGVITIGPSGTGFTTNIASTIEIAAGTLRNTDNSFTNITSTAASTTVDTGATFDIHDTGIFVANLQGSGAVTLGTSAATTLVLEAGNFGGVISGAGQINKFSPGTLVLSGANTYSGGTSITAGKLQIGNGGTTGSIVGTVLDNALLVFDRSNALTFAGIISGHGTLTQAGVGVLTLTGRNTYTGGTTVNAGTVSFNNSSALGTGSIQLNNGAGVLSTTNLTLANPVAIGAGETGSLSAAAGITLTVNDLSDLGNAVFGSAGHTGIIAFGPLVTNFTTVDTASVEVAAGTLRNTNSALNYFTSTAGQTTVDAGAILDVNDQNLTVSRLQGAGSVTLGTHAATTLTVNAGIFSGTIAGAGQLNKMTSDTLELNGANSFTGGTTISVGAVQIGNGGATGSILGNVVDNAEIVFDRNNALTFAGKISGTGVLTQLGTGVLTLTAANSYSGGTILDAGSVSLNNPSALGTGAIMLNNGGGLITTSTLTMTDPVSINTGETGALSAAPGTTLTVNALSNLGNVVFGRAGSTGVITFGPPGAGFTTSTASTIEIAAGTLRNTSSALTNFTSTAASTTVDAGATLDIHDSGIFVANLQGSGAVTLGTSSATNLVLLAGNFGGVISGAGQITKFSHGTLALSHASTYTGGTTITQGTLLADNPSGSATGSGPVAVNMSGTTGGSGILGGSGTIAGAVTLNPAGIIAPGAGSPGTAGTTLHAPSVLWNGGGQLNLQLGATADQLALSGALTKGTLGTYTLDLFDAGITQSTYTLATFASTTFSLSDFALELPGGFTGTLVETTTSLMVENLVDTVPHADEPGATASFTSASTANDSAALAAYPTPEPGSATLLAFAASVLLSLRRRRRR
jgi:autotransporter-associated beta strand protein